MTLPTPLSKADADKLAEELRQLRVEKDAAWKEVYSHLIHIDEFSRSMQHYCSVTTRIESIIMTLYRGTLVLDPPASTTRPASTPAQTAKPQEF